ncbi:MAG: glutamate/tyrosine decarboxylase-like PLP-dependent enzyme [Myxococcota bacterium]|jgi:glutamate/tyrosine decarboxylase-like PLP-dependent enzyme
MTDLKTVLDLHQRIALEHHADVQQRPVRPYIDPELLASQLNVHPDTEGLSLEAIAERLAVALAHTPATTSPRFFNQLFGGQDPAALLGEMLAPLLNTSMYTYKVAAPHVLIENALIARMAALAGMSGGEGTFTPGGSLSNQTAMMLARNIHQEDCREEGMSGARLRIYSSAEAHYSIRKSAGILGIGRSNVVSVAADDTGRMDPVALSAAIAADRAAGHTPLMINATAGTTVQGAFDPIPALADIAEAEGLWLHVDGAWGGSFLLSETTRHRLDGLHRADSFTWDAHKMMGVPLTCSILLTRRPDLLTAHLSERANYLLQGNADRYNPATRSIQCGRRNDILKLWTAWLHHGDAGYAARIDHLVALTAHAVSIIEAAPDMTLHHRPQALNVCFTVDGCQSADITEALHASGLAMVGTGMVAGQKTIRLVVVNPAMTTADIDIFFAAVRQVVGELPKG